MGYRVHEFQLADHVSGEAIIDAGGVAVVTLAGGFARATLYDPDNDYAALSQPVSLTRGTLRFAVIDTSNAVDVFGLSGDGRAFQVWGKRAGTVHQVKLDRSDPEYVLQIPFDAATDGDGSVDSGFDEPAQALFRNEPHVWIAAIDATETIDVGTTTDPNGFLAAASVATLGHVQATIGALLTAMHLSTSENILFDLSAGSDTAQGYIYLPYRLARIA